MVRPANLHQGSRVGPDKLDGHAVRGFRRRTFPRERLAPRQSHFERLMEYVVPYNPPIDENISLQHD
jgi:hypothetical protein